MSTISSGTMRTAVLLDIPNIARSVKGQLLQLPLPLRRGDGSLRGRNGSAATFGPKHRPCNVHNELTRSTCVPTASLAACLHPRPGGATLTRADAVARMY